MHRLTSIILLLGSLTGCAEAPPTIVEVDLVPATEDAFGPYDLRAVVQDDRAVSTVTVWLIHGVGDEARQIPLVQRDESLWHAEVPAFAESSAIYFYVEATDYDGGVAFAPEGAPDQLYAFGVSPLEPTADPEAFLPDSPASPDTPPVDPPANQEAPPPPPDSGPCTATLNYPLDASTLRADDDDLDQDTEGVQSLVLATTDAPDGTAVRLFLDGDELAQEVVANGHVRFSDVPLPGGELILELVVDAPSPCADLISITVVGATDGPDCLDDTDCPGEGVVCFRSECVAPRACTSGADCSPGMLCHQNQCIRPQELPADACNEDQDCPAELICSFGHCAPELCRNDEDCLAGERCFFEECLAEDIAAPDTCRTDDDCGDGEQCLAGLCAPRQCVEDADCAGGGNPVCFNGFCLPFAPPVAECETDEDCPGGQQCAFNSVCLPGFLPLPDSCIDSNDCPEDHQCLLGGCVRTDCTVKAECPETQDCRFGFCVPEDLPPPVPGTCGPGLPDCPEGSTCTFTICIPDALPVPRPCNPDGTCPNERQQCIFGLLCLGF